MPSSRRSKRRPYTADHVPVDEAVARGGVRHVGEFAVRNVAGSAKSYRCPGCEQLVTPGAAHVVVWSLTDFRGPEAALADRRHWHGACWARQEKLL